MQLAPYGVWASHLGLMPAAEARRTARSLERRGYATLWVGEAEGKEAIAHAALLLAATDTIQVATGIANIWARDALAMRNAGRTLGEWFPGRFLLGVGASHAPLVEGRGHGYDRPYAATVTYLSRMVEAPWRGPDVPVEPPLLLAALGPRMLALARDHADGAHTFLVPPEHTRRARDVLGEGRLLVPEQAVVLADSRAEARRSADRHLTGYLRLGNYRRNLERLGFDRAAVDDDELFDALIAWGDTATVAGRLRAQLDAGADQVAVHPLTPAVEVSPLPQLEALAAELGLEPGQGAG